MTTRPRPYPRKWLMPYFLKLQGDTQQNFSGCPFGTSRKKASTIFYNTASITQPTFFVGCV